MTANATLHPGPCPAPGTEHTEGAPGAADETGTQLPDHRHPLHAKFPELSEINVT